MIAELRRARALLAGMWTGPEDLFACCYRNVGTLSDGEQVLEPCAYSDEMVSRVSVLGALKLVCRGDVEQLGAMWETLRGLVCPVRAAAQRALADLPLVTDSTATSQWQEWAELERAALRELDLTEWLQHPERKLDQVLAVFDRAITRENGK